MSGVKAGLGDMEMAFTDVAIGGLSGGRALFLWAADGNSRSNMLVSTTGRWPFLSTSAGLTTVEDRLIIMLFMKLLLEPVPLLGLFFLQKQK